MVFKAIHNLTPNYLASLFNFFITPYQFRDYDKKLALPDMPYYQAIVCSDLKI